MRWMKWLPAVIVGVGCLSPASAQTEVPLSKLKIVAGRWEAVANATFRGKRRDPTYMVSSTDGIEFALNEEYDWFVFEAGQDDSANRRLGDIAD